MALNSYYVIYAGVNCTTIGLYPVRRPSMPTPARRATKVTIPGRDGDLYVEDGAIEDISIQITFDFHTAPTEWGNTFRALKAWAASRTAWDYTNIVALRFSDDPEYFYSVKRVVVNTTERTARQIGQATVTFVCDGWSYLYAGSYNTRMSGTTMTLTNDTTETAWPVIGIQTADEITITVEHPDGTTDTFVYNAGANVAAVIDTWRHTVYRKATGESWLARTSGSLDAFRLEPGETTITVSSEPTSFFAYPLWRVL